MSLSEKEDERCWAVMYYSDEGVCAPEVVGVYANKDEAYARGVECVRHGVEHGLGAECYWVQPTTYHKET